MDAAPPPERLPPSTLAIPLGLAGLAQLWTAATRVLGAPTAVGQGWWLLAGFGWLATVLGHARRGRQRGESLAHQLRHLAQGPMAALLPVSAMLLGAGTYGFDPVAGKCLTVGSIVAAAGLATWTARHWVRTRIALESVHGGHYLPISAAGLVGALAAASVGLRGLAVGCLAVGGVFWVVTTCVVWLRLVRHPQIPDEIVPTLAILMAPPAIAAVSWTLIVRDDPDVVLVVLTAVTAVMVGVQVRLLPRYRSLRFSLTFWSFTFPASSVAGLVVTWIRLEHPVAWRGATVAVLTLTTGFIGLVGAKSLSLIARPRPGTR